MNAEIIHRLEDSFEGYALEMDFETGQPKRSPPVMSLSDYLYRAMTEEQIIDLIDRYSSELGQAAQALSEKLQDRK